MSDIKRYYLNAPADGVVEADNGSWCHYGDVKALVKERDELRAQAYALVWCLPEETLARDYLRLREEARGLLLGKDKQIIAKLTDELRCAQEALLHVQRPPLPGVNNVYGTRLSGRITNTVYPLMITKVNHAPNGGLEIEVQLPP